MLLITDLGTKFYLLLVVLYTTVRDIISFDTELPPIAMSMGIIAIFIGLSFLVGVVGVIFLIVALIKFFRGY